MAWGLAVRSRSGISSISPSVEILPIWPAAISTNHKAEPSLVISLAGGAADTVGAHLREPHRVVRTGGDTEGSAIGRRHAKGFHFAIDRNAADSVILGPGEPQGPSGPAAMP